MSNQVLNPKSKIFNTRLNPSERTFSRADEIHFGQVWIWDLICHLDFEIWILFTIY